MVGIEERELLTATSSLISEGIDLTKIQAKAIARSPLTFQLGSGIAVAYRFGAIVVFDVEEALRREFIEGLRKGSPAPEIAGDSAVLKRVVGNEAESVDSKGAIFLKTFDLPRLRVVAEVLSRSAILSHYESHMASVLLDLEPPVERLRVEGRLPARARTLLRRVGEVLHTEMRMIGRAEVSEKPEFVWDLPELDRLYLKLAEEYELTDRDHALSRKLDLAMRTSSILIEALGARRALHVEWAIFLLILAEVFIAL